MPPARQENESLKVAIRRAIVCDVYQPRTYLFKRAEAGCAGAELRVLAAALNLGCTHLGDFLLEGVGVARHGSLAIIAAMHDIAHTAELTEFARDRLVRGGTRVPNYLPQSLST